MDIEKDVAEGVGSLWGAGHAHACAYPCVLGEEGGAFKHPAVTVGISSDLLCDPGQDISGLQLYHLQSQGLDRESLRLDHGERVSSGEEKHVKHLRSRRGECFDSREITNDLDELWPFGMK